MTDTKPPIAWGDRRSCLAKRGCLSSAVPVYRMTSTEHLQWRTTRAAVEPIR